jgi:hypothetical protein
MKLDWRAVRPEHAARACELVSLGAADARKTKGLFVLFGGRRLPAKDVARVAYKIAHELPQSASIEFASGEGTLKRLQELGLEVQRL